ncbi:hypothetical protein [Glutamicibacter sp.]|uniref:hypothetical protein n=1 Tax=Glutamicibacter sp. TaxID=1931995 RepID=UPI0028BD5323|nr:hypothetical protein [Glutamicibacter sp.]
MSIPQKPEPPRVQPTSTHEQRTKSRPAVNPLTPPQSLAERRGIVLAAAFAIAVLVTAVSAVLPLKNLADSLAPTPTSSHQITASVISEEVADSVDVTTQTIEWWWNGHRFIDQQHLYQDQDSSNEVAIEIDDAGQRIKAPIADLNASALTFFFIIALAAIAVWILTTVRRTLSWWLMKCRLDSWAIEWEQFNSSRPEQL